MPGFLIARRVYASEWGIVMSRRKKKRRRRFIKNLSTVLLLLLFVGISGVIVQGINLSGRIDANKAMTGTTGKTAAGKDVFLPEENPVKKHIIVAEGLSQAGDSYWL